jgi:hypothetical protein
MNNTDRDSAVASAAGAEKRHLSDAHDYHSMNNLLKRLAL